ncbi:MAG: hypothetical protein MJ172_09625 [Clostridia bacterium]|nr:hypothetical protein [Clostridia bacterium]
MGKSKSIKSTVNVLKGMMFFQFIFAIGVVLGFILKGLGFIFTANFFTITCSLGMLITFIFCGLFVFSSRIKLKKIVKQGAFAPEELKLAQAGIKMANTILLISFIGTIVFFTNIQ